MLAVNLCVFLCLQSLCTRGLLHYYSPPSSAVRVSHREPFITSHDDASFDLFYPFYRDRALGRVFSIADIHGDYDGLIQILGEMELIDDSKHWSGGNAVLVQTGDILDRGKDSADVLRLFARLKREACEVDGNVILLLGNHEWMNINGDFSYAGEGEDEGFKPFKRNETFEPGGEFHRFLRSFPFAARVLMGEHAILFMHAGIVDESEEFTRFYSHETDESLVCDKLHDVLLSFESSKMVIGHTVQAEAKVRTRCDGKLVLGDTGFAPYYFGHPLGLEHYANGTHRTIELPGTSVACPIILPFK